MHVEGDCPIGGQLFIIHRAFQLIFDRVLVAMSKWMWRRWTYHNSIQELINRSNTTKEAAKGCLIFALQSEMHHRLCLFLIFLSSGNVYRIINLAKRLMSIVNIKWERNYYYLQKLGNYRWMAAKGRRKNVRQC